ncbi:MAG: FHA domain-containing protein [Proteobacteria bacterium]|nr:FHA domain-containing protein [Pseudomonadota bacterium]
MGIRLVLRSSGKRTLPEGMRYEFEQARVVIGRAVGSDVCIPHPSVSETHAIIEHSGSRCVIVDQGSLNGTRVNDTPLVSGRPKALQRGDIIRVADFTLLLEPGLVVAHGTSRERTASLARRLIRELSDEPSPGTAAPRLVVLNRIHVGEQLQLAQVPAKLTVGRGEQCQWRLDDPDVSRQHLEVVRDHEGVLVRDLGSKNGLRVTGRAVTERRLRDGDELQLGELRLLFEDPAEEAVRRAASEPVSPLKVEAAPVRASPDGDTGSAGRAAAPPVAAASQRNKTRPSTAWGAELVVYALAAVVVAVSALALFALLGAP